MWERGRGTPEKIGSSFLQSTVLYLNAKHNAGLSGSPLSRLSQLCCILLNIDNGILIDIIIDIKMKVRQILSIHNLTLPIVSRAALPLPLPNDNDNT